MADKEKPTTTPSISPEERERLVAAGAWFRAKERGFAEGDRVADWLSAEAEVDASVRTESAEQRRTEYEADRRLRWSVAEMLGPGEPISAAVIDQAIERAAQAMVEKEGYDAATVAKVATTCRKDVAEWAERVADKKQEAPLLFGDWSDRGQLLLESAATDAGDWPGRMRQYLDQQRTYYAGEVVSPGAFACLNCGTRQAMEATGHLGACPHCYHTYFRRV